MNAEEKSNKKNPKQINTLPPPKQIKTPRPKPSRGFSQLKKKKNQTKNNLYKTSISLDAEESLSILLLSMGCFPFDVEEF